MLPSVIGSPAASNQKHWRADAISWNEQRQESFAGLHNAGRRILVVFDEASAIADSIWETTEGALTDYGTEIIWACFGNPTRGSGRFFECFHRFRNRWVTRQVDSRTAKLVNKAQIRDWEESYGEDSDFFRVRVRGVFPRMGSMQFISSELAAAASGEREPTPSKYDPFIMGVDVARFGSDKSVICFRRGRDARSIRWITLTGVDTMTLAARIVDEQNKHRCDAIFVDEGGVGGGVVDRLRQLRQPVIGVQFGSKSNRSTVGPDAAIVAFNKRAEMWIAMRSWLEGGCIPADQELLADLTGVEYGNRPLDGRDAIILLAPYFATIINRMIGILISKVQ
jgi:hypothetical protein